MKAWVALGILAAAWLEGGQFRYGLGRTEVLKAKLPGTPLVAIGAERISIDVKDATAPGQQAMMQTGSAPLDPTPPVTALVAELDQALGASFQIVQSGGGAALRVAITHSVPAESRLETVQQKARVAAPPNADGTPQLDPATGRPLMIERVIAVEQWTARGELAARVEVVDASGALIDAFTPRAAVRGSQVVSVDGQDRVDRTQIPSHEVIRAKLLNDVVAQFVQRYAAPPAMVEILLAVDEELRPGNKLARDGDLRGAEKAWREAALKSPDQEGDRQHNLAALWEARAYDQFVRRQDLGEVEANLKRALELYREAAAKDPKERQMKRAQERVEKALAMVAAHRDLEAKRLRALAARQPGSPWPPGSTAAVVDPNAASAAVVVTADPNAASAVTTSTGNGPPEPAVDAAAQEALQAALADTRPDSPSEKTFRDFVRLRLRADGTIPGDEVLRQVESAGGLAYGLTALQSKRVVVQEAQAWTPLQPKFALVKDSAKAFLSDGKLTEQEQGTLEELARNLGLTAEDLKSIVPEAGKP